MGSSKDVPRNDSTRRSSGQPGAVERESFRGGLYQDLTGRVSSLDQRPSVVPLSTLGPSQPAQPPYHHALQPAGRSSQLAQAQPRLAASVVPQPHAASAAPQTPHA